MEELVWTELKCRRVNITKTKTHWKVLNSSNERCVYFIFCHLNTSSSASWRTWGQRQRVRVVCNIYGHNLRPVRAVIESLQLTRSCIASPGDVPAGRKWDRAAKTVYGLFSHHSRNWPDTNHWSCPERILLKTQTLNRALQVSKCFLTRQKSGRRDKKYSERMFYIITPSQNLKKSKYSSFSIASSYNSLMGILYLPLLIWPQASDIKSLGNKRGQIYPWCNPIICRWIWAILLISFLPLPFFPINKL